MVSMNLLFPLLSYIEGIPIKCYGQISLCISYNILKLIEYIYVSNAAQI